MRKAGKFFTLCIALFCLAIAGVFGQQPSRSGGTEATTASDNSKPPAQKPGTVQAGSQANPQSGNGSQTPTQPGISSTIRVPVNLVNILFTVTDKKNRMVNDLSQRDFRVLENSKPQNISFFSREANLPLRIGILIDTSNSIRERLHFEQEAAIDFLSEILRPERDQAFAVAFDV
jgi:hypothetical protein